MGKSSSKKLKEPLNNNKKIIDGLKILIIAALAVVIFYPPYLQGLFFEKHILPSGIFVFSLFIIFCVYKWTKKDYTMFKTPIEYLSLAFVVVYFISIFVAVHTRSAIIELFKYFMYFAVFYMITSIAESNKTKLIFLWTITASAVGVSIIGLDSAIGGNLISALNKLFNSLGVQGDMFFGLFVENRINSTLQYPNALASYVMGIFFVVIGLILSNEKLWVKAIGGICAYILFLTFMLTESRGAQLLFPAALIIFLFVSPKGCRTRSAVHVVLFAFPAVCASFAARRYLSASAFNKNALLLMVIGLFTVAILALITDKLCNVLQKINWKVYLSLFILFVVVLVICISLVINSSIPLQLSHGEEEPDGGKMISRDIVLKPGNDYDLTFTAESNAQEDRPYAYYVRISSKNKQNVLSSGDTQLVLQTYKNSSIQENAIHFTVPNDSYLINIMFFNYFNNTSVTLDNVKIIDSRTGRAVKDIVLKSKYNLDIVPNRFNNLQADQSGLTRIIYYKDGIKIFSKAWLLGAGGGAWEYLYRQYQSFNYQSSQAHNYPLQLGIETGILGLLVLASLIIVLINCYVKYHKKHSTKDVNEEDSEKDVPNTFLFGSIMTAIVSLFLHSFIDFDFAEASMLLLFWQLIAILNSEFKHSLTFKEMLPLYKNVEKKRKLPTTIRNGRISIFFSAVIAIALLSFTANFIQASSYAKKAFDNLREDNIDNAINNMIKAIEKDKYNERYVIGYNPAVTRPDIKTGLADILLIKTDSINRREQNGEQITQTELAQSQRQFALLDNYIKQAEKKADNNLLLSNNLASFNFSIGQIEKGIMYLNNSIKLFRFEPSIWKSKINLYYQLIAQYFNSEDYANAKKNLDIGLDIIHEASVINTENISPFTFDEDTMDTLQTMQFMNDFWNQQEVLSRLNKIVHYTIPYMDVNLDNVPDQWQSDNAEFISLTAGKEEMIIKANGDSFIYTKNPIKLEKDKKYFISIELDRNTDTFSYEIAGITEKTMLQAKEQNKYIGEFRVENEPNESGNQFKLFLSTDCIVNSILVYSEE